MKAKDKIKDRLRGREMVFATNRRLQETTQKLFMAKRKLEEKNKELKEAKEKERRQKEELLRELNALKKMARAKTEREIRLISDKKLTTSAAEDFSLRYIKILRAYIDTKDLDKEEQQVEELCRKFAEYDISPKGIIELHLKAIRQVATMGGMETQRITFEARMALLMIMTRYAGLLRENAVGR